MGKTIEISEELEKKIVAFCDDELYYHIYDSGCADEYKDEIAAQIELLRLLGYEKMADTYERALDAYDYEEYIGGEKEEEKV